MSERAPSRIWAMRLVYLGLALLIMFFHLLPLETVPRRLAPPDLLIAFTFAWSLRRPDFVPILSVALVMLLADLLFGRPPGLLSSLVVIGAAYLRGSSAGMSDASFVGEWLSVGAVLVAVTLLNRVILGLFLVQQAPLWLTLSQLVLTVLVYPLVAFATQYLLGVRKLAPSDAEAFGGRA
ncbi:rod shape-determining protein MreD [Primorskyibacter sp. S87]|uniref:rod shape-determining protein MreD n=1 Tax=Primorskyibacter sp. S87 TaxID=3415126 RepID=UPI003C7BF8C3